MYPLNLDINLDANNNKTVGINNLNAVFISRIANRIPIPTNGVSMTITYVESIVNTIISEEYFRSKEKYWFKNKDIAIPKTAPKDNKGVTTPPVNEEDNPNNVIINLNTNINITIYQIDSWEIVFIKLPPLPKYLPKIKAKGTLIIKNIITAAYGGHDRGHGTEMKENMTIPMFLSVKSSSRVKCSKI